MKYQVRYIRGNRVSSMDEETLLNTFPQVNSDFLQYDCVTQVNVNTEEGFVLIKKEES